MGMLDVDKDFNMLSLPDLLAARDLYHLHLLAKQNVVSTAVGRYLIRKDDPWPDSIAATRALDRKLAALKNRPPRTLDNSEVRPYSWPCVIVFVSKWVTQAQADRDPSFAAQDMVPKTLYMPDGTKVPVCVVYAPLQQEVSTAVSGARFPDVLIGGGYPLLLETQGRQRIATVGCLVTDGHYVYALTNRHVVGDPDEPIYTLLKNERVQIGTSSKKQVGHVLFQQVYESWAGKNVYLTLDAGLIRLDDVHFWTTNALGIGQLGHIADLSASNLSLRLIGCPVIASAAASGIIRGQVQALFYRYRSVAGFEFVSDFLIGARDNDQGFQTSPGDSGALWMMEAEPGAPPLPIAMQWGGHRFLEGGGQQVAPYALASALSTICKNLEVEIIREWNYDVTEYWGAVGHYTIATRAIELVRDKKLAALMQLNLPRITYPQGEITKKTGKGLSKEPFVPLADVPDMVWKVGPHRRGGQKSPEHANHFADMDKPDSSGKTLLQHCEAKSANIDPAFWEAYYKDPEVEDEGRGLLPFRVWQIYEAMVGFARSSKLREFVCAAGILSHYIGDACQPLHISYLFNGDPDDSVKHKVKDPKTGNMIMVDVPRAAGVHGAFEDGMINYHIAEIQSGLRDLPLKSPKVFTGGFKAAKATVSLMADTFDLIAPKKIISVFLPLKEAGEKPRDIADAMWAKLGNDTISVMGDGARCLALLWESAWKEGKGSKAKIPVTPFTETSLAKLYQRKEFLPSYTLRSIADKLGPP
jgi:hypothetical protein